MELEELKTENENEKELSMVEKEKLFNSIVRGQDVTEVIDTSRGKFKIKFPRIRDIEKIGRLLAARTNGIPVSSFDTGTYSLMNEVATLDVLILSGPSWFENAKTENKHGFTWSEIPDQNFVQEVYLKVYEFRNKIQKLFETDKESADSDMAAINDTQDSDGPDLFDGLSGSK